MDGKEKNAGRVRRAWCQPSDLHIHVRTVSDVKRNDINNIQHQQQQLPILQLHPFSGSAARSSAPHRNKRYVLWPHPGKEGSHAGVNPAHVLDEVAHAGGVAKLCSSSSKHTWDGAGTNV